MKKRHEAEEIIRILRDIEKSGNVSESLNRHNISAQTYYRWRRRYGAMSTDEARRVKEVEKENAKLKKIVAEQTLIIDGLREINSKKF